MCPGTRRAAARAGNEQVGMRAPGSEQARRGVNMGMMMKSNTRNYSSGGAHEQIRRGRGTYGYRPNGVPQNYARCQVRNAAKENTNEVRSGGHGPGVTRAGLGQSPARFTIT